MTQKLRKEDIRELRSWPLEMKMIIVIIFPLPISKEIKVLEGRQTDGRSGSDDGRGRGARDSTPFCTLFGVNLRTFCIQWIQSLYSNFRDIMTVLQCVIPSSFWTSSEFLLLVHLCQFSFLIEFLCYTTQVHTSVS